jgi:hypothetical protein
LATAHTDVLKEDDMAFVSTFVVAAMISASTPPPVAIAHSVMFRTSLKNFVALAHSLHRDARLDWSTDGCSVPIIKSTGRTFDFTDACHRHDFGYRNFKVLNNGKWWTSSMRHRIDKVFHQDMLRDCRQRVRSAKTLCRAWANTFYRTVRAYAGP